MFQMLAPQVGELVGHQVLAPVVARLEVSGPAMVGPEPPVPGAKAAAAVALGAQPAATAATVARAARLLGAAAAAARR